MTRENHHPLLEYLLHRASRNSCNRNPATVLRGEAMFRQAGRALQGALRHGARISRRL